LELAYDLGASASFAPLVDDVDFVVGVKLLSGFDFLGKE
jgi:hypothetical protein